MWLLWGAALSCVQLAVYNPDHLVALLIGMLRLCGMYSFHVTNDHERHPQLAWLEWYLQRRAWTFGRSLELLSPLTMRCHGNDLKQRKTIQPDVAYFVLSSGPFCMWDSEIGLVLGVVLHGESSSLPWTTERHVPRRLWLVCTSRAKAEVLLERARLGYARVAYPPGQLRFYQAIATPHWAWWKAQNHPPICVESCGCTPGMRAFRRDARAFVKACRAEWHAGNQKHKYVALLHGGPGGGKTHCVKTVAEENGLLLYDLNMSSGRLDDLGLQLLQTSVSAAPKLLLVDEFDGMSQRSRFIRKEEGGEQSHDCMRYPSKAGLHKLLDCEIMNNVIVALVTNRTEEELTHIFGPAMLRSMRIDKKYHFGEPDAEFLRHVCARHGLDPALSDVPPGITVADVMACLRDTVPTTLQLRAALTDLSESRLQTTLHGEAEQVCQALGIPPEHFLAPLASKNVSTISVLMDMNCNTLASTFEFTVGRAHELALALNAYEEREFEENEEDDLAPYKPHVGANTPIGPPVRRRLLRALRRQGGYARVHEDARVSPANMAWLTDKEL